MNAPLGPTLDRRSLLRGGGALIVSFSMLRPLGALAQGSSDQPKLPGDLSKAPMLDSWIRIAADGKVTVFTGKAELGQGIGTALIQVAAEELRVDPATVTLITADTERTPDEGYTAASHSMEDSGTAIFNAAAQVRTILVGLAANKLGVSADQLRARDGAVVSGDGRKVGYGDLVSGDVLHQQAQPQSDLLDPATYTVIGKPLPRFDIPPLVTGGQAFVQDLRLKGMVHARVVRPPNYFARLKNVDTSKVEALPGFIKVVRNGNYLAVVAKGEYQAVEALNALANAAEWEMPQDLPDETDIYGILMRLPADSKVIQEVRGSAAAPAKTIDAIYHRPYQMHGSIGPSCAVGHFVDGKLTIWTHTQGVYPDRKAIAQLVGMPEDQVHLIQVPGSGCYGHNGADDAAADAAIIALAVPGTPVRVQWMREQENGWEPYGPAMITRAKASLDASGKIVDWNYEVWSNTHAMRPGPAGNLLAGGLVNTAFPPGKPVNIPQPAGGGDRNAVPLYEFASSHVVKHFIPEMPMRVSALRSLGAYMNVFSIESFMDELALAAKVDPVEFRLDYLKDERARAVVTLASDKFGWANTGSLAAGHGRGFAFAQYKNLAAYCAVALEVEVTKATGRIRPVRVVAACDSGMAVNPDGIRNQIEGAIIQSLSWTLYETVSFSKQQVTSRDWASYPMLRFPDVPTVEVHVIDQPGKPFLGTGEAGQGPAAAALANALANATGVRIRDLPMRPERVKAALGL